MELPNKLKKHKDYDLYYLVWSDGVVSKDFYNLTWANQHMRFLPDQNYKSDYRKA